MGKDLLACPQILARTVQHLADVGNVIDPYTATNDRHLQIITHVLITILDGIKSHIGITICTSKTAASNKQEKERKEKSGHGALCMI